MTMTCKLSRQSVFLETSTAGVSFLDFDNSSSSDIGDGEVDLTVSQNLFNNDAKYEYIQDITQIITDGENQYKKYSGFKIVNEDGKVIQEILAPFQITKDNGYSITGIIRANDKYFIVAEGRGMYQESVTYMYPINRNTANGISPLGAPVKISASPSLARRGQTVTVQLDEDATRERTVTVTNAAGQRVWRGTAKPGQKTVTISTDRLSHGVNIVNVEGESARATCKVIVR